MPVSVPGPLLRSTAAEALAAVEAAGGPAAVPSPLTWDPARHLRGRFGYGATLADNTAAPGAFDPDAWWDAQLALARTYAGFTGVDGLTGLYPALGLNAVATRRWIDAQTDPAVLAPADQFDAATLLLRAFSPAQLYETAVEVLGAHLWVPTSVGGLARSMRAAYDTEVIRPNALGSYTDALLASARHPAMLDYLDNTRSSRYAPNENYGRELLELHTVGTEARYSQAHVVGSSRAMSGRTVDDRTGAFSWRADQHWIGRISVLGFVDANNDPTRGLQTGDRYLRYLATHPLTASRLARRLCVRFVSDAPSAELVQAVADTFTASGQQLLPALSAIVRSTEFWASRGAKVRRPNENVLAAVRVLGVSAADLAGAGTQLRVAASTVAQKPFANPAPAGDADTATAWQSAGGLVAQWKVQRSLAAGTWSAAFTEPVAAQLWGSPAPPTAGDAVDAMFRRLHGTTPSAEVRAAVLAVIQEVADRPLSRSRLTGQLGSVVALLLHGPYHALR